MVSLILILGILIVLSIAIISSLPLYIAVNMLGGKVTILKVFLTNTIVALLLLWLTKVMGWSSIILFILTIIAYKFIFKLGLLKSAFAWVLQYIVVIILGLIVGFILTIFGLGSLMTLLL